MYYRRIVLLAVLEQLKNPVPEALFQNCLFLFTRFQQLPAFDFVPAKSGCYSFTLTHDIEKLKKKGHLQLITRGKENYIAKYGLENFTNHLHNDDHQILMNTKTIY